MLISSKFHDFYDTITSFGVDKTVVYHRLQSEIKWKNKDLSVPHSEKVEWKAKGVTYEVNKYLIGFCGKIYPVVEFRLEVVKGGYRSQFFYDAESVQEFLSKRGIKQSETRFFWRESYYVTSESSLKNWFNATNWSGLTELFQEHKVPVFVLGRFDERKMNNTVILNPNLKSYQFFKVQDAVTAFQNIYMFVSGVLGMPEKVTVKLNDKDLAEKKGHGGKYSFRRTPTKKKKGR